jgi:hypothetical protein
MEGQMTARLFLGLASGAIVVLIVAIWLELRRLRGEK